MLLRKGILFMLLFTGLYVLFFAVGTRVRLNGTPIIYRLGNVYHWKGGDAWQRYHEYDPQLRHDVVVLGSSHAYRGYDPELFARQGIDLFNLGSSGQTAMNTHYLLDDLLSAENTGLLIVEVSKAYLESDGLESTCELVQNIPLERAAVRMALSLRDPRAANLLALRWAMHGQEPIYRSENYTAKGYCRHTTNAPADLEHRHTGRFDPLPDQVEHLRSIIALCAERGIPLVLVSHPIPPRSDPERHRLFAEFLYGLVAGTEARYLDLATALELDDQQHFADHSHLNQAGVERFVPALIDSLAAHGLVHPKTLAPGTTMGPTE